MKTFEPLELISLAKIPQLRGELTFLHFLWIVPFEIKRVCWTCAVPLGEFRYRNACRTLKETSDALSGSLGVIVTRINAQILRILLNRRDKKIFLHRMTCRQLEKFLNCVFGLNLSSGFLNENDCIADFNLITHGCKNQ
jgi:hypothetical protein